MAYGVGRVGRLWKQEREGVASGRAVVSIVIGVPVILLAGRVFLFRSLRLGQVGRGHGRCGRRRATHLPRASSGLKHRHLVVCEAQTQLCPSGVVVPDDEPLLAAPLALPVMKVAEES